MKKMIILILVLGSSSCFAKTICGSVKSIYTKSYDSSYDSDYDPNNRIKRMTVAKIERDDNKKDYTIYDLENEELALTSLAFSANRKICLTTNSLRIITVK